MIDAVFNSISQMFTPALRRVLLKAAGLALIVIAIIGIFLHRLLAAWAETGANWAEQTSGFAPHAVWAVLAWVLSFVAGLGIVTGADLRDQTLAFLQQHFGKAGPWYHAISRGQDDRPVVADRPRKSVGSETTFAQDLSAPADIEAGVLAMLDEAWAYCEKSGITGRTVTVKVKYADFQIVTRSHTGTAPFISNISLLVEFDKVVTIE